MMDKFMNCAVAFVMVYCIALLLVIPIAAYDEYTKTDAPCVCHIEETLEGIE